MAEVRKDCRYTKDHEWALVVGDKIRVGITQFAANQLGDVVLVDLSVKPGDSITAGNAFGTVESVKSVSDLFAPLSGTITAINGELDGDPELVNTDPYGDGWMLEITPSDKGELDTLLDAAAYEEFIKDAH